jgi:hypothetical protein
MSNSASDHSPPRSPNFLQRQLERARFERALEVADSMVEKGAFLNPAELARINNILLGREQPDPWREGPAVLKLPSGRVEKLQILADPVNKTREILREARQRAVQPLWLRRICSSSMALKFQLWGFTSWGWATCATRVSLRRFARRCGTL